MTSPTMNLRLTFTLRDKERKAITAWWRRHGRWVYEPEAGKSDCTSFIVMAVGDAIGAAEKAGEA